MARIRPDQPLLPSVLDRLLDFEPETSREAPKNRAQVLRELKESVRRDLENLLNTRQRNLTWPPNLTELERSLLNYGIPDITALSMGAGKERQEFCRQLQSVILKHEPRLKTCQVVLLDNTEPLDRTLRFRIDALMHADPAPEPVMFDSSLKPGTGSFEVKGGNE
jgi:type VI secretion system protein ImpF